MQTVKRWIKRAKRLFWPIAAFCVTVLSLTWGGSDFMARGHLSPFAPSPAIAQDVAPDPPRRRRDPREAWRQVYQRLPDFPRENDYIQKETGEVDADNTLASRLIAYHLFVKNRLPMFRLDWKFTLADYLGANQEIDPVEYPGYDLLAENPLDRDRAAIAQLNRQQRDELIYVLVTIFNPNYDNIEPSPAPEAEETPPPPRAPDSPAPLPEPGDADLLKL